MKKIRLHPDLKKQIAKELECSGQTVDMSLVFVFNSDKSKNIRKRAIELLQQDVKRAVELTQEEVDNLNQ
ncbi:MULTISPECIES: hypothetical protein [Tenacibaculum]|uniref:Uncharacterized protein n=2 Tax=Tenacibaculum TaxID=104267 RepID=A0ABP1EJE3_9FLAO|nr:hypothetical protein [Tenacibaculum finnmarkense]SOS54284.1 conserved hypothetical protein [Tenacibaculum dicentrarchi]MBE7649235.1 hypothetical protein [Tenacibaculum finnmarkense genomovar ulcerans]MCD8410736.1 hypothetical protein [Tenacibaculum finnmarkense genomovar ulcerans]MCG8878565.1 hypothetical protein [Tenacibaculum finnmarkense]MCG8897207.1 hypothetical protein [Tenacibaculum finnmarkense]